MKKLKSNITLLLFVTMFTIQSMAQVPAGFKIVPDSLRCLTPTQINRHISDAFVLSDLRTSNVICAKKVLNWENVNLMRIAEVNEAHKQESLQVENYKNCKTDMAAETAKLNLATGKIKFQKVVICVSIGVAILELGYIGIQSLRR